MKYFLDEFLDGKLPKSYENLYRSADMLQQQMLGGVLKVYFPFSPVPGDYRVLDTDYENYACVWSCVSDLVGLFHTEIGYILTREQEYNPEYVSIMMV